MWDKKIGKVDMFLVDELRLNSQFRKEEILELFRKSRIGNNYSFS
jgi:hypothetical protein